MLHLGKPEKALECFEPALKENASHDQALFGKAVALQQLGQLDEASEVYRKLLPANPNSPELLGNLIALSAAHTLWLAAPVLVFLSVNWVIIPTNFNTATEYAPGAVTAGCTTQCTGTVGTNGNAADFISQQNPATVTAQTASTGSSASQNKVAASANWSGTSGSCPLFFAAGGISAKSNIDSFLTGFDPGQLGVYRLTIRETNAKAAPKKKDEKKVEKK